MPLSHLLLRGEECTLVFTPFLGEIGILQNKLFSAATALQPTTLLASCVA